MTLSVDSLTIYNKLATNELAAKDISCNGVSILCALFNQPEKWEVDDELKIDGMNAVKGHVIYSAIKKAIASSQEYTAIEIFPTDVAISAGMVDSNDRTDPNSVACAFNFDNTTATGLTYVLSAPATGLEYSFEGYLRNTAGDAFDEDLANQTIIDWGDGSATQTYKEAMKDGDTKKAYHTYAKSGKYIVKVWGPIAAFKSTCNTDYGEGVADNPVCRIFDKDLPIASTCWNLANIACHSNRILKVQVPGYNYKFPQAIKLHWGFYYCKNLQSFSAGSIAFPRLMNAASLFYGCCNLKSIKWNAMAPVAEEENYENWYHDCTSLTGTVDSLLPLTSGWKGERVNVEAMFTNCSKLTISNLDAVKNLLWDNSRCVYTKSTGSVFSGCSAISAQVPESWGGAAS